MPYDNEIPVEDDTRPMREIVEAKLREMIEHAVKEFDPNDHQPDTLPGLWVECLGSTIQEDFIASANDAELLEVYADMHIAY